MLLTRSREFEPTAVGNSLAADPASAFSGMRRRLDFNADSK
jgi:hypothetical protein